MTQPSSILLATFRVMSNHPGGTSANRSEYWSKERESSARFVHWGYEHLSAISAVDSVSVDVCC